MERWLFAGFLILTAAQDLRKKQVDIWLFVVFGSIAFLAAAGRMMAGAGGASLTGHLCGAGVGALMLAAAYFSRGEIGAGDGSFFLVSGMLLGFWENLMLLFYGTLLCGIFSLGYLVWSRFHSVQGAGSHTVPFLPFLVPPGMWLVLWGSWL